MKEFTVWKTEDGHHLLEYNIFHELDPHYQPSKPKMNVSKPAPPHPMLGAFSGFTKHHQISNNDVLFSANHWKNSLLRTE